MNIEFMLFGNAFAFLHLVQMTVIVALMVAVVVLFRGLVNSEGGFSKNIKSSNGVMFVLLFAAMIINGYSIVSGVNDPKLSIDTAANPELQEYQRNTEPVVIETPAPRTQVLDGFKPLGE